MIKRTSIVSRPTITITGLGLALVIGLSSLSAHPATYYRWVDEAGVTHYTSTPPLGIPSEKVTSATRNPSPTPEAAEQENKEPAPVPGSLQQEVSLKDPERCSEAQSRLATLRSGTRIRMATEDGGFRYLNEQDIADEVARAQQAADESC